MPMNLTALLIPALSLSIAAQPAVVAAPSSAPTIHGEIIESAGLRIVHAWGTPEQRGRALGNLLGKDVVRLLRAEYGFRFGSRKPLLENLREGLDRAIQYDTATLTVMSSMYAAMLASGIDLRLPEFDRPMDLTDLHLVNALDVIAPMACSGFTLWGDQVVGKGVLTTRNFDWPFSGPHIVDDVIILVQYPEQGVPFASVTWPGYLGAVTAVNAQGVATFMHVGNGKIAPLLPGQLPTAIATANLLAQAQPAQAFELANKLLAETAPPVSYITRVVLPSALGDQAPERAFEVDSKKVASFAPNTWCVVTNHFQSREDTRDPGADSTKRHEQLCTAVSSLLSGQDQRVDIDEAWQALAEVDREGRRFGTLHSLVYRAEPWHFELRIGEVKGGKVIAAPVSTRRHQLTREQLFRPAR